MNKKEKEQTSGSVHKSAQNNVQTFFVLSAHKHEVPRLFQSDVWMLQSRRLSGAITVDVTKTTNYKYYQTYSYF